MMGTKIHDLHKQWQREDDYHMVFDELEGEFNLAAAIIEARLRAGLSQAALAKKIGTKQPAIARMEGGKLPSTATLQRIAKATGSRLRIAFDPQPGKHPA
jgi:ribosome-binding protein aMBF1 (putative translation factor)